MKPKSSLTILIATLLLNLSLIATAQTPPAMGAGPAWNVGLNRLFGDVTGFKADAEMRMLAPTGQELMRFTGIRFFLLDERVRVELDMSRLQAAQLPPGAVASMERMGMHRMVNILIPQTKSMLLLYPELSAFVQMPIPDNQAAFNPAEYKMSRTALESDSLDGQPVQKTRVTITDPRGATQEAVVWTGTSPKDFPVQLEFSQGDQTVLMRFRNVELTNPEPSLFEPPSDYARHAEFSTLMQAAMQRMLSGASGE